jgi:hypothetical protein
MKVKSSKLWYETTTSLPIEGFNPPIHQFQLLISVNFLLRDKFWGCHLFIKYLMTYALAASSTKCRLYAYTNRINIKSKLKCLNFKTI